MNGDELESIWSKRRCSKRGWYWKFECDVMKKHSDKRKAKYSKAEPCVLFVVSRDRPSRNFFKGRPKGIPQKVKACQHCKAEQPSNAKTCSKCLNNTGFWSV